MSDNVGEPPDAESEDEDDVGIQSGQCRLQLEWEIVPDENIDQNKNNTIDNIPDIAGIFFHIEV